MSTIEHDYAPICDLYERHLGSVLFEPYAIDLARYVSGDCARGSVLETACGTGIVTRQLRAHVAPTIALTATDINPGMLDYAQRKLKDVKGINWRQADIAHLPFPDASFDVAVCQFGLMFVPVKTACFAKCAVSWYQAACSPSVCGIAWRLILGVSSRTRPSEDSSRKICLNFSERLSSAPAC